MNLKTLQKNWNDFGIKDPLWAILTADEVKNNKWDLKKFFETGEQEIDSVLRKAKELGMRVNKGRALDFGCGVGRLTLAMAKHFKEAHGVDIALSMIDKANELNNSHKKVQYHLNEKDDLSLFNDGIFDFIYSNITLQHMKNRYSKKYIKEFLRVLKPGGLLVFQIPSNLNEKNSRIYKFRHWLLNYSPEKVRSFYRKLKYKGEPVMEMHPIKKQIILKILKGYIVEAVKDNFAGENMDSYTYFVQKSI